MPRPCSSARRIQAVQIDGAAVFRIVGPTENRYCSRSHDGNVPNGIKFLIMSEVRNNVREREQQVLQMRLAGVSELETAEKLGLSRGRVRLILRSSENAGTLARRTAQLLEDIRQADDLDRKWPVVDLIDALSSITVTRNALVNHFKWNQTDAISLRELMDVAISPEADSRPGYLITPLLSVRCVGKKGFWSVVNSLTKVDLGSRCNQEWDQRLERLKRAWRIRGDTPYSWSKPCEPRTEWLENPSPNAGEKPGVAD